MNKDTISRRATGGPSFLGDSVNPMSLALKAPDLDLQCPIYLVPSKERYLWVESFMEAITAVEFFRYDMLQTDYFLLQVLIVTFMLNCKLCNQLIAFKVCHFANKCTIYFKIFPFLNSN